MTSRPAPRAESRHPIAPNNFSFCFSRHSDVTNLFVIFILLSPSAFQSALTPVYDFKFLP